MTNGLGPAGDVRGRLPVRDPRSGARGSSSSDPVVSFEAVRRDALRGASPARQGPPGVDGADLPPASAGEATRLRWAAEQLEALLLHELLKSMQNTVVKTGLFDSPATKMFEEMLDEERANRMAQSGGIGLADLIYEQMSPHLPAEADGEAAQNDPRRRV